VKMFKVVVPVLIVCLAVSLSFNIYQFLNDDYEPSETEACKSKTFVFYEMNQYHFYEAVPYRKLILNSTEFLRVEITFNWTTDDLMVTATVNDDDYHPYDYLGLAFDANQDGYFEKIYRLDAYNYTVPQNYVLLLTSYGGITWLAQGGPHPSSYHYCTFNSSGYFFHFWIPKETINFRQPMPVFLCFGDLDASLIIHDWEPATAYWQFEV